MCFYQIYWFCHTTRCEKTGENVKGWWNLQRSGSCWTYLHAYLHDILIIYHKYVILSEHVHGSLLLSSPPPPNKSQLQPYVISLPHWWPSQWSIVTDSTVSEVLWNSMHFKESGSSKASLKKPGTRPVELGLYSFSTHCFSPKFQFSCSLVLELLGGEIWVQ